MEGVGAARNPAVDGLGGDGGEPGGPSGGDLFAVQVVGQVPPRPNRIGMPPARPAHDVPAAAGSLRRVEGGRAPPKNAAHDTPSTTRRHP